MKKYRCEIWFTREETFFVNAYSEKEAKKILERIVAEKKNLNEKITGKYIHEVYNKQERKAMTNRDRFLLKLIDIPDRELANIYCTNINDCHNCHFVGMKGCFDKLVDWLKQECKNNE